MLIGFRGVASVTLVTLACVACERDSANDIARPGESVSLDSATAATIRNSVRAFVTRVASDVTRDGPKAWLPHFAHGPEFFMAYNGQLVVAGFDAGKRMVTDVARSTSHIELAWTGDLHIDPIAPGLAVVATGYREVRVDTAGHRVDETGFVTGLVERPAAVWQFRNIHWSVPAAPR